MDGLKDDGSTSSTHRELSYLAIIGPPDRQLAAHLKPPSLPIRHPADNSTYHRMRADAHLRSMLLLELSHSVKQGLGAIGKLLVNMLGSTLIFVLVLVPVASSVSAPVLAIALPLLLLLLIVFIVIIIILTTVAVVVVITPAADNFSIPGVAAVIFPQFLFFSIDI
ncbi:hypothetical protein EDB81DRAFT_769019 [Dactylonectria macrodidyma]|uniref:Uncharacterized protein n=1 Tax=Dactylonectria macrodidyma TaxID=307937 RepID=A0A9P9CZP7_9HYPO|nr:hypothetical protein EDB81DRAFT_769019 [Dactylonectria macrodidyma]